MVKKVARMFGVPFAVLGCGIVGLASVLLLTPFLLTRFKNWFQREADWHHIHSKPVPRHGGLVLLLSFWGINAALWLLWPEFLQEAPGHTVVLCASIGMFALGFRDDIKPLGAKKKLLGQVLIASGVYFFGVGIETFRVPFSETIIKLGLWGYFPTVIWLVGITNLINIIDGVDGLASGIVLMLMGLLVYVGWQYGAYASLAAGMAGALLGFLRFNFQPAKIYLGDGGAYLLGFQVGILSILESQKGSIIGALIAPLFVLALPIIDTSLAILRRGLRGLPLFRADRSHIHHRLLRLGMSHRRVVLGIWGVTLVYLPMSVFVFRSQSSLPLMVGAAFMVTLFCARQLNFSRRWFEVRTVLGINLAMRKDVKQALWLTKWFEEEATSFKSPEELYNAFVLVVFVLGFTGVKLTLAGEEMNSPFPNTLGPTQKVRHELGHMLGVLELEAPLREIGNEQLFRGYSDYFFSNTEAPGVENSIVFELLGELLAEAWVKGMTKCQPALCSFD